MSVKIIRGKRDMPELSVDTKELFEAAEEMKNSSIETSFIKLEFEDRGTEYTILRKQKFIKQNNVIKPNIGKQ